MESATHSIIDAALRSLPIMLPILDFSTLKNELFPVIAAVFSKTSSLGIKVRGLEAFAILCGWQQDNAASGDGLDGMLGTERNEAKSTGNSALDKYTIQEKVVPLLKAIKTKEPAVVMAALNVFKQVGKVADSDFLAIEVLPILWSFSLGPLLNLQQFRNFMDLIKALSSRIEQEQSRKLQELTSNSVGTSGSRSQESGSLGVMNASDGFERSGQGVEEDFERLVLGQKTGGSETSMLDTVSGTSSWAGKPPNHIIGGQTSLPPSFSWSTAPSGALSTQLPVSRAITPDQNLSSFASLVPSTTSSAQATPQVNGWAAQRASSNPAVTTLGSFSSATTNMSVNPSVISIAPPPQQRQIVATTSNTFPSVSIAPPPARSVNSVGQPRYGAGLGGSATEGGNLTRSKSAQKQGLDAYESLL